MNWRCQVLPCTWRVSHVIVTERLSFRVVLIVYLGDFQSIMRLIKLSVFREGVSKYKYTSGCTSQTGHLLCEGVHGDHGTNTIR